MRTIFTLYGFYRRAGMGRVASIHRALRIYLKGY
jgi:hypothetical protein